MEAAVYAAKLCQSKGVKVSYDAAGTYPNVERLMPHVDWLIPSEEFALKFTYRNRRGSRRLLYETYNPELVVITQVYAAAFL